MKTFKKRGGGYLSNTPSIRLFKQIRLVSIPLLFTFILTVSSVYADNNNTYSSDKTYNVKGVVNYNKGTIDNSEQYELKINKDVSVNNVHVELLPDDNGKYWIPKGYKVKVSADCDEGYEQSGGSDVYTMNDTQTVSLDSTPAPPSKIDELETQINNLQTQLNAIQENSTWKLLATVTGQTKVNLANLNCNELSIILRPTGDYVGTNYGATWNVPFKYVQTMFDSNTDFYLDSGNAEHNDAGYYGVGYFITFNHSDKSLNLNYVRYYTPSTKYKDVEDRTYMYVYYR